MYPYPFVSQMPPEHSGSGWNDCAEASLGAYLLARGKMAPGTNTEAILQELSQVMRGGADLPSNGYTTLEQLAAGLQHYGLPAQLSYDYQVAMNAPWAICLVDGTAITRADGSKPYPASWFGGHIGPDHFVVWGPPFAGGANWIMNPLDPAGVWAQYDLASLQSAFSCAYLLPAIAAPKPVPAKVLDGETTAACGLKPDPSHGGTDIAQVPADATIAILPWQVKDKATGELWQRIRWRDTEGWVLNSVVRSLTPVPHG